MSERVTESGVRVGDLTIRTRDGKAEVVERRRKVGRFVLACEYVWGVLDTDEPGTCWSHDHGGPRCAPVDTVTSPGEGTTDT